MKTNFLGIDPGIANCGYCLLSHTEKTKYHLVRRGTIKTKSNEEVGKRLADIYGHLHDTLATYYVNEIIIEQVFFSRNVTSAFKTAKVIGLVEMLAHKRDIPVIFATPTAIKKAVGLTSKDNKNSMKSAMSQLVKAELRTSHEADACAAACYGIISTRG